eukprot:jgi/Mesen1/3583/ME000020S03113
MAADGNVQGKRKRVIEEVTDGGLKSKAAEPAVVKEEPPDEEHVAKRLNTATGALLAPVSKTCMHEVATPPDYVSQYDEQKHGTIQSPLYNGPRAKQYPFQLDPFQEISVACLERHESVLVSAHTSAGKTAIAEYAIAMAFRDKQRVIYTSPLKALSNQKYRELAEEFTDVGLMTGDVTIAPNAMCIVMTTEILRSMLYRGSEVLREVAWVVFDEIHYMRDRERGVVWEESIIFLPPAVKMVFLSATMSNAAEFAAWICHLHRQPCHVVYTDFRPTPLQHFAFPAGGKGLGGGRGGGGAGGGGKDKSDVHKIVKMIKERSFHPVIVFSFSRRECEQYALQIKDLDFNSDEEKEMVDQRHWPPVCPSLRVDALMGRCRGLSLLRWCLQFAMGLNMPARTVVFTSVRKWDGESHRWMASGEYIQMSGRAGRRGKDDRGICIMMVDENDMILGKPAPLESSFRLSYYTLLNLMSRAEGKFNIEHVIAHSFHQFQHEKQVPEVQSKLAELEAQAAALDSTSEVHVKDGKDDWGWGVLVTVTKRALPAGTPPAQAAAQAASSFYVLDTLLLCAVPDGGKGGDAGSSGGGLVPRPCPKGTKGEMHVIPVLLPLVSHISSLRVALPEDLRPPEARRNVQLSLVALEKQFPDGFPSLDPVEDMGINDEEFIDIVKQIEEKEAALMKHPLFKSEVDAAQHEVFEKKAELAAQAQQLRLKMRESQLSIFRTELHNRSRVLKRLGHISADGVVQLKGRAACLITTADELLTTELMFDGAFNDLEPAQVVAATSCFLAAEKSNETPNWKELPQLHQLTLHIKAAARRLAEIQKEEKIEIIVDDYVDSFKCQLMEVMYKWSSGASFSEVMGLTDMFEGTIIRTARRLDELLNEIRAAAKAVGDTKLEKAFEKGSESIRRGIIFANSLYL